MTSTLDSPFPPASITGEAAIYIRISSHQQEDGVSLDVQLESCRTYCENNGLVIVGEFKDVQSGLVVERPQYQQMLGLAKTGGFNKLIVYRYDRSGRDDAEFAGMLRDFTKLGISLVSASGESPDPLFQKLAGLLAWNESRTLSVRVSAAKMKRYTEGKWNVREVITHLMDTERVFAFRALTMARQEGADLPGMDQDEWTARSDGGERPLGDLIEEWAAVRHANVLLFASFDRGTGARTGIASDNEISVRALPWLIAGHELWHRRLIAEHYVEKSV